MTTKHYGYTTSVLFAIIGALHLWRVLAGWPITIGAQVVPTWPSWVALVVAGYLGWQGCRVARRV
jgi:hypothetical protein